MTDKPYSFAPRGSAAEVEEGLGFAPRFDRDGLIVCVAAEAASGEVLMVAYMNAEALARTIATGEAWYFSRSRNALWRKGETSGRVQRVVEMRVDCDQDTILIKVDQAAEGACHTGRVTCFYRSVPIGEAPTAELRLTVVDGDKAFDPNAVYGKDAKPSK